MRSPFASHKARWVIVALTTAMVVGIAAVAMAVNVNASVYSNDGESYVYYVGDVVPYIVEVIGPQALGPGGVPVPTTAVLEIHFSCPKGLDNIIDPAFATEGGHKYLFDGVNVTEYDELGVLVGITPHPNPCLTYEVDPADVVYGMDGLGRIHATTSIAGIASYTGILGPVTEPASGAAATTNFVIQPCLDIVKTVDFDGDDVFGECETNYAGLDATWKIRVENCGDVPLKGVTVEDTNGMEWGPFDLAVDGWWETTYVDGPYTGSLTNTATAEGLDPLGGLVGPVSDDACIETIDPCIAIQKLVDFDGDDVFSDDCETGYAGDSADWKIIVTNCGDSDLSDVMVTDTNGMAWGPFDLPYGGDPWEMVYTDGPYTGSLTNTATAEALDVLGGAVGPVEDPACIETIDPCIAIEKTVDFDGDQEFSECETYYSGADAVWKIVVTNCGDSDLFDVMVTDTNGMEWGPFDLPYGGDPWEMAYTELDVMLGKTNTATAEATDELGGVVGPVSDDACVETIDPEICIQKLVDFDGDGVFSDDCETGPYDGPATWKIIVTNCGDSDLFDVMVEDTNGMEWGPFDLPYGSDPWEVTYVDPNIVADKTNTATAAATDELGGAVGPVSDDACVIVEMELCWADETAWAYGGDYANPNWDYVNNRFWGWTNGPLSEGSYEWDLYAGAGQNILSNGTVVGKVHVDYFDGCVTVTYEVDEGYAIGEAHLWVGNDVLPSVKRGKTSVYTNAPGQFPFGGSYGFDPDDPSTWETTWTWSQCGFEGDIYVAAHAVVWGQVECMDMVE